MKHFFNSLIFVCLALFTGVMLFMRITTGSFEDAGRRMDGWTGNAADDIAVVASDAAVQAEMVAKDIADGPDEGRTVQ